MSQIKNLQMKKRLAHKMMLLIQKKSFLLKLQRIFSNRQDVINKSSLRHLKKFYVDIFKHDNLKLVRSRFCNLKSSCITKLKFKSNTKNYILMFLVTFKVLMKHSTTVKIDILTSYLILFYKLCIYCRPFIING